MPHTSTTGHGRTGAGIRDLDSNESRIDRADITTELGDVLWYVAVLADYLYLSLDDVATANLAELASRAKAVEDVLGRLPAEGERLAVIPRSEWRVGLDR